MPGRTAHRHRVPDPVTLKFDRGTLLLTGSPGAIDLAGAPGVIWDPRVRAYRAPAASCHALRRWLGERGINLPGIAGAPRPTPAAWSQITLRPYQEAALDAWELGQRRGVIALPTGSGKTRISLAAMKQTGLAALCLVPTRVLLDQWAREISAVYRGPIGRHGDGAREVAPITVATYESAYRHMSRLGDRFELLIVDEAHHVGGGLRDEALEMSVAGARLGLTATPPRGDAAARLAELVGPTVFELSIGDLAGGFLASFDMITLHLDLGPEERAAYANLHHVFADRFARFRRQAPDAGWAEFVSVCASTVDGRRALAARRQAHRLLAFTRAKRRALASLLERHRHARVLVFTADNETAYAIARTHLIMPLTCDIGRQERDLALDRFRQGEILALVSARVLNEGIDVPDADVAVVLAAFRTRRQLVQQAFVAINEERLNADHRRADQPALPDRREPAAGRR